MLWFQNIATLGSSGLDPNWESFGSLIVTICENKEILNFEFTRTEGNTSKIARGFNTFILFTKCKWKLALLRIGYNKKCIERKMPVDLALKAFVLLHCSNWCRLQIVLLQRLCRHCPALPFLWRSYLSFSCHISSLLKCFLE